MRCAPIIMSRHSLSGIAVLAMLLGGCGDKQKPDDARAGRDPAVVDALSDPLMADPDLVSQNRGGSALSGGGPASGQVPLPPRSPEEIEAAKQAAADLAGGALASAPSPAQGAETSPLAGALTAEAVALASGLAPKGCARQLGYSFVWAARLAPALAPYPRGHVQEAAGSDAGGCRLRVVNYLTPVDPASVVDFHYAMARKGGLQPVRRREGSDDVIAGNGFAVYVRLGDGGFTEVDVISAGP